MAGPECQRCGADNEPEGGRGRCGWAQLVPPGTATVCLHRLGDRRLSADSHSVASKMGRASSAAPLGSAFVRLPHVCDRRETRLAVADHFEDGFLQADFRRNPWPMPAVGDAFTVSTKPFLACCWAKATFHVKRLDL